MCEPRWPVFREKNWGCSCHQIPWRAEGHEGLKLGYPLGDCGLFHRGHRAIDDCHALLALLGRPLRVSGQLALAALLETARKPTVRLWAQGSPIETKELLKARRYRWSGSRRCWYIDLDEDQIEIERTYLSEAIYRRPISELPADRFTARDRFSVGIGERATVAACQPSEAVRVIRDRRQVRLSQPFELEVGVLVEGGYPGVADAHITV